MCNTFYKFSMIFRLKRLFFLEFLFIFTISFIATNKLFEDLYCYIQLSNNYYLKLLTIENIRESIPTLTLLGSLIIVLLYFIMRKQIPFLKRLLCTPLYLWFWVHGFNFGIIAGFCYYFITNHERLIITYCFKGDYLIFIFLATLIVYLIEINILTNRSKTYLKGKCENDDSCSGKAIDSNEQDKLQYGRYVNDLLNTIKSDEDFHVIALYGQNGTGKTSIINLLKKELKNDKNYRYVALEPYKYKSEEEIVKQFFISITSVLNKNMYLPYVSSMPDKYFKIIYGIANKKQLQYLVKILSSKPSYQKLQENLKLYLKLFDKKIIVLIDDLDRCSVKKRYLIFQLINFITRMDRINYVLSASPDELFNTKEPDLISLVD